MNVTKLDPQSPKIMGVSFHDIQLRACYDDLWLALGEPNIVRDGKVHVEWTLEIDGDVCALYDWKCSIYPVRHHTVPLDWNIGAFGSAASLRIKDAITELLNALHEARK